MIDHLIDGLQRLSYAEAFKENRFKVGANGAERHLIKSCVSIAYLTARIPHHLLHRNLFNSKVETLLNFLLMSALRLEIPKIIIIDLYTKKRVGL